MTDAETTAETSADGAEALRAERLAKRRLLLTRLGMVLAGAAALWAVWYLLFGRNHTSTDDAYVNAEVAQVTPLYAAAVTAVRVRDTDVVKPGDILLELDPTNARIALAQAEADLAAARRHFRQLQANGDALDAQVGALRDAGLVCTVMHSLPAQGVDVLVKGLIQMDQAALTWTVRPMLQGGQRDDVFFSHTLRRSVTPAGISDSSTSTR